MSVAATYDFPPPVKEYRVREDGMVWCPRCPPYGKYRPADQFAPHKSRASGYTEYCRDCSRAYHRAYYLQRKANPAYTRPKDLRRRPHRRAFRSSGQTSSWAA